MLWANPGSHSTRQVPTHAVAAAAATAAKIRLISGRSTEPAARAARAFDRDIMALLLHRAINRDIAAGKFKKASAAPNFISKEVT